MTALPHSHWSIECSFVWEESDPDITLQIITRHKALLSFQDFLEPTRSMLLAWDDYLNRPKDKYAYKISFSLVTILSSLAPSADSFPSSERGLNS